MCGLKYLMCGALFQGSGGHHHKLSSRRVRGLITWRWRRHFQVLTMIALLFQSVKSIEERTRPNLCKTLKELGLSDGQELAVADVTTPQTVLFKLNFTT